MPREIVTLQVGQCGNQVGRRFWDMALAEHAGLQLGMQDGPLEQPSASALADAAGQTYDDSMSSFFHLCADGRTLKARAVLVDMEEGPVSETLRGPLGGLFDGQQLITDVSGAGNNFAHGHNFYGPQYAEGVLEAVRAAAEVCDSLQSFFLMHSLGGGTGSGLGTYLLGRLEDHFPGVHRFVSAVFPSPDDDVVTSPYNSMLALHQSLTQLLAHNPSPASLGGPSMRSVRRRMHAAKQAQQQPQQQQRQGEGKVRGGFDEMNAVIARVLIDMTASMRFAGDLNVDLNEVTTNLVPYPRLHYLMTSLGRAPDADAAAAAVAGTHGSLGGGCGEAHQTSLQVAEACEAAFARRNQLMRADPREGTVLACALLFRGDGLSLSDVTSNVQRLQGQLRMIPWNPAGFKISLCSRPALGSGPHFSTAASSSVVPPSLLCLSNNSCMATTFARFGDRFQRLYRRKAMVHHYAQYMDAQLFDEAYEGLLQLVDDYRGLDSARPRIPGGAPAVSLPAGGLFHFP